MKSWFCLYYYDEHWCCHFCVKWKRWRDVGAHEMEKWNQIRPKYACLRIQLCYSMCNAFSTKRRQNRGQCTRIIHTIYDNIFIFLQTEFITFFCGPYFFIREWEGIEETERKGICKKTKNNTIHCVI